MRKTGVEKTSAAQRITNALLALAVLATPLSGRGQKHYSSNVALGVKGGADYSMVFFNPSVKQKLQQGVNAGLMVRYVEENHFGLIGEVNFAQRGWAENFEQAPFSYSRTFDYVEIPVLAHIFFGNRGRFFFNAGPQIGIFLGEKTKSNFDPKAIKDLHDFPSANRMTEQLNLKVSQKFDYGISAGIGGEFNLNRRNSIMIETRFYYGLANVLPSKRSDTFSGSNQMTLSASIGYWFRIK